MKKLDNEKYRHEMFQAMLVGYFAGHDIFPKNSLPNPAKPKGNNIDGDKVLYFLDCEERCKKILTPVILSSVLGGYEIDKDLYNNNDNEPMYRIHGSPTIVISTNDFHILCDQVAQKYKLNKKQNSGGLENIPEV